MKQVRENIWQVTYTELGKPVEKSVVSVEGHGKLMLDHADMDYIKEYLQKGFEPTFFVSHSPALRGEMVVVSRQRV